MATYYWVGGNGTWDNSSKTNWATVSGGAGGNGPPLAADTVNFDANSGTGTCTVTAGAVCDTLIAAGPNITIQLTSNFTATSLLRVNAGTFDLNNNTATSGVITSNVNATRTIAFGSSGKFICTRTAATSNAVDFYNATTAVTLTGTPLVEFTGNTSVGVGIGIQSNSGTPTNPLNVRITNGSGTFTFASGFGFGFIDLTGFNGTLANSAMRVYGNFTVASTNTLSAGAATITFAGTSGTQQITTNGKTLDFPLTFNGIGGTFAFQDALTQGSTRAFTITNGTVQLKNGVTSTVGTLATSGTNQKVLQSTSDGSQATLSQASGNFNAQYLTVKDISATGNAKFNALNNCITQGNNSGWYFAPQLGRPLPAFAF